MRRRAFFAALLAPFVVAGTAFARRRRRRLENWPITVRRGRVRRPSWRERQRISRYTVTEGTHRNIVVLSS